MIVHYGPGHHKWCEYVFNRADIDHAQIVWARDMGPAKTAELINCFKGRRVWLLKVDDLALKLAPYRAAGQPSGPY